MKIKQILFLVALLGIAGWGPFSFLSSPQNNESIGTPSWLDQEAKIIQSQANNLDPTVLKLSLTAYMNARKQGLADKGILTIIDYTKPSTERRLWVVNLKNGKILFNTLVAHGKNSGALTPTSFSNQPGSLKSSFGVFLTDKPYIGGVGYALRLIGLERGVNDNAYQRDIVVHGAWYAGADTVRKYGQLGRSWGCPAVSNDIARPIIDTIKEKTLVFVYSNDRKWLRNSTFLAG